MPLAYQSWSRSFRAEPSSQRMGERAFFLAHRDVIDRLLAGGARVLVARDVANPGFIFGWICAERHGDALVAHYCYVKRAFRCLGIGHALLADAVERLGEGAADLRQTHGSREFDHRLAAMGFRKLAVEQLLHSTTRAA